MLTWERAYLSFKYVKHLKFIYHINHNLTYFVFLMLGKTTVNFILLFWSSEYCFRGFKVRIFLQYLYPARVSLGSKTRSKQVFYLCDICSLSSYNDTEINAIIVLEYLRSLEVEVSVPLVPFNTGTVVGGRSSSRK